MSFKNLPEKILVVDDDDISHFLYKKLFDNYIGDVDASYVFEAEDACKMLADGFIPCLVFLDLNMPGMNGFEFLRWCDEQGLSQKIRVIVVSSSISEVDRDRSLTYQCVLSYETKPLSRNLLERCLNKYSERTLAERDGKMN